MRQFKHWIRNRATSKTDRKRWRDLGSPFVPM